jgi:hypothetical protein
VPDIFPFSEEQVTRIARTEPTLRDMLQQCRHLFDHLVYGPDDLATERRSAAPTRDESEPLPPAAPVPASPVSRIDPADIADPPPPVPETLSRVAALLGNHEWDEATAPAVTFKSVEVIEAAPAPGSPPPLPPVADEVPLATPVAEEPIAEEAVAEPPVAETAGPPVPPSVVPEAVAEVAEVGVPVAPEVATEVPPPLPFPAPVVAPQPPAVVVTTAAPAARADLPGLGELWDQEQRAARRKLEPEGALTGATRELQAGLGAFLSTCHEHGVKVGPWRLQHVVPEWTFGDHPTYGAVTIAHWACKDGQPWKIGIGLFLARGAGKPKDLEVKLGVMNLEPAVVDSLILLRPEDDLTLTGKSKTCWQDAERRGKHARLEAVSLDGFAQLYSFPRWLATVRESLPEGTPLPNLADIIQEKCEKLLEQVCMPVQG